MGMNPEIKAEWIRRLRSGDYEQGRGSLCRNDKYCCLGVLSEIAAERHVTSRGELEEDGWRWIEFGFETSTLPAEVQDWSLVLTQTGIFMLPGEVAARNGRVSMSLAWLNDTGLTFSQIADIIEVCF